MRSSQLRVFLREVSTSPYICENAIFERDVHIRECSTLGSCYLASRRSFGVSRRLLLKPQKGVGTQARKLSALRRYLFPRDVHHTQLYALDSYLPLRVYLGELLACGAAVFCGASQR